MLTVNVVEVAKRITITTIICFPYIYLLGIADLRELNFSVVILILNCNNSGLQTLDLRYCVIALPFLVPLS